MFYSFIFYSRMLNSIYISNNTHQIILHASYCFSDMYLVIFIFSTCLKSAFLHFAGFFICLLVGWFISGLLCPLIPVFHVWKCPRMICTWHSAFPTLVCWGLSPFLCWDSWWFFFFLIAIKQEALFTIFWGLDAMDLQTIPNLTIHIFAPISQREHTTSDLPSTCTNNLKFLELE